MWTIIKYKKDNFNFLRSELTNKLGREIKFYNPKILINKFDKKLKKNDKIKKQEINLLGNYCFCYHADLRNPQKIEFLKTTKGLDYFLNGFKKSQIEIEDFIKRCKKSENNDGYITYKFFDIKLFSDYKFHEGPFAKNFFKVLEVNKNKIKVLIKNLEISLDKNKYLFY